MLALALVSSRAAPAARPVFGLAAFVFATAIYRAQRDDRAQ